MANKKINFDVFQLKALTHELEIVPVETLWQNVLESYTPVLKSTGHIVLVGKIQKKGKYYYGTLAHNQMNDLPQYLDTNSGDSGDLPLKSTMGLAHYTSFVFDESMQMLIFESKMNGVHLKNFCQFLQINYSINSIDTEIVIDPIEMKKLNDMTIIKKFNVKIAKVVNGEIFASKRASFKKVIQSADDTNSDTLEYTIRAERGKSASLRVPKIKQMARDFLQFKQNEEVKKLEVIGKESEDDNMDTINFIANRVRLQIEVERKRFSTSFALEEKYSLVTHAYEKIRPDLMRAYKKKTS